MFRIDRIVLRLVSLRLKSPFVTAFGAIDARPLVIVELHDGDTAGIGECPAFACPGYTSETSATALRSLREVIAPPLLGVEFTDVEALRRAIAPAADRHPMACAAVEAAAWDLSGRLAGESVAHMLGGVRARIETGVVVGLQSGVPALLARIGERLAEGYTRVKIKITPDSDVAMLEAVRRAFPALRLQVDANGSYGPGDLARLASFDAFDLVCIEQPFDRNDLASHAALQARIATPVCLDESITSLRRTREALDAGACRIVSVKPAMVGGLTEARAIHDLCFERGIPVICGGMLSSNIGRAADLALASLQGFTLPNDISASNRYFARDIAAPDFLLGGDSTIGVPTLPGMGIHPDDEAMEACTLHRFALSLH